MLQKVESKAQLNNTVVDISLMSQSNPGVGAKSPRPVICDRAESTEEARQNKAFIVEEDVGSNS